MLGFLESKRRKAIRRELKSILLSKRVSNIRIPASMVDSVESINESGQSYEIDVSGVELSGRYKVGKIRDPYYERKLEVYYKEAEGYPNSLYNWQNDGDRYSKPPIHPTKPEELTSAFAYIQVIS